VFESWIGPRTLNLKVRHTLNGTGRGLAGVYCSKLPLAQSADFYEGSTTSFTGFHWGFTRTGEPQGLARPSSSLRGVHLAHGWSNGFSARGHHYIKRAGPERRRWTRREESLGHSR